MTTTQRPLWACLAATTLAVLLSACYQAVTPTSTPTPQPTHTAPAPTATPAPTSTPTPPDTPTPRPTLTPPPGAPDRYAQAERLGAGINLANALQAPYEGAWGIVLQEEYFQAVHEAGFDTVRIPIRWSAHAAHEPPYTIQPEFFERVDWAIEQGLDRGLNVVINVHHYDQVCEEPRAHTPRLIALWEQIAARYKGHPEGLYFELYNEPYKLSAWEWNVIQREVVLAIRRIDSVHTLILSGVSWGGINGLSTLQIPEGKENALCSIHLYEPMLYTHQGAAWLQDEFATVGVTWPGPPAREVTPMPEAARHTRVHTWFSQYNALPYETNPAGPSPITSALDKALAWQARSGCPLWLGEFGVHNVADQDSRVNWTRFVRQEVEARGIPWAAWEFGTNFNLYDRRAGRWNEKLLEALLPSE